MIFKSFVKRIFGLVDREDFELLLEKVQNLEALNTAKEATENKIVEQKTEIEKLTSEVEKSHIHVKGLSEKASTNEKIIAQQKAEIMVLQSKLEKLKSQSDILEKIATFKEEIANNKEKRGKGRPAKGRVDYHLKMDADLKMMEMALKKLAPFNPQDVINDLYRSWLEPKFRDTIGDSEDEK